MAIKLCNTTARDVYLINDIVKVELKSEDVLIFEFELCNTEVDKDNECIMPSALRQLKDGYVGRKGFVEKFNTRLTIFDTWIEKDIGETCLHLKAKAFLLKNKNTQEFIDWIKDATIKKEIGIGFSLDNAVCSICGQSECGHIKGHYYHDVRCMRKIIGVADVYGWSIYEPLCKNKSDNIRNNNNKELKPADINSCIEQLFHILTELDARNRSHNCVIKEFGVVSWVDLCCEGIELLKTIRD